MKTPLVSRRVALYVCISLWGLASATLAVSSLPHNVLSPGLAVERTTRLLLPEGWGFFTRDAREPDVLLAYRDGSRAWRWEPPHADARNWFGLKRTSRVLPYEARRVMSATGESFTPCTTDLRSCLAVATIHHVPADSSRPFLCGEFALIRRAPVPWAWRSLLTAEQMPTEVHRAQVECSHDEG